jgi:hypothetical protein
MTPTPQRLLWMDASCWNVPTWIQFVSQVRNHTSSMLVTVRGATIMSQVSGRYGTLPAVPSIRVGVLHDDTGDCKHKAQHGNPRALKQRAQTKKCGRKGDSKRTDESRLTPNCHQFPSKDKMMPTGSGAFADELHNCISLYVRSIRLPSRLCGYTEVGK